MQDGGRKRETKAEKSAKRVTAGIMDITVIAGKGIVKQKNHKVKIDNRNLLLQIYK